MSDTPANPPEKSLADLVAADKLTRAQACQAEIEAACAKYKCKLEAVVEIRTGKVAARVEIEAL